MTVKIKCCKAAKPHICDFCNKTIDKKSEYVIHTYFKSAVIYTERYHVECHHARMAVARENLNKIIADIKKRKVEEL